MKRLILTIVLVALIATPALASIGMWWERGDPGSSYADWEFTKEKPYPEVIEVIPNVDVKAWPNPDKERMSNPDPDKVMLRVNAPDVDWTEDFISGTNMQIYLEIPNFEFPNEYKEIWVDLGFKGDKPVVTGVVGEDGPGHSFKYEPLGVYENADGDGYIFGYRISPNPELEKIWVTLPGEATKLDYVHLDTICVPEPATLALLGLGALSLLRRKTRT